CLLRWFLSG
ncbi:oligopeptide transport system permease oppB domain protein, partial [Vibrio parahaemolyticus V-223/04]